MMQKTVVEQSQESLSSVPVLYKSDNSQSIEYNPTQEIIRLYSTLSEKDTVTVYQKAAEKTWDILKQAIAVIWVLFRLLIALIIWVCGIAYQSGRHLRYWLEVEKSTPGNILKGLVEFLKQIGCHAYEWATSFISKNLGLEIKLDLIAEKPSATKSEEIVASGEDTMK